MSDPTSTPQRSGFEANISSPLLRRKSHPWAWIIGLLVATLLIWGFFGMDHLKVDPDPVTAPVAIEATID